MVLFAQVREDPRVELHIINEYLSNNSTILCITSGGCTTLSLSTCPKIKKIDSIDQLDSQNYLCELKYAVCDYYKDKENIIKFYEGVEELPPDLELSKECRGFWHENKELLCKGINQCGVFEELFRSLIESNMDYELVFNKDNLIKHFGENAVVNSIKREFSVHFSEVMDKCPPETPNYFHHQILFNSYSKNMDSLPHYLNNIDKLDKEKINYITDNFFSFIKNCERESYDFIHTSNITDWLNSESLVGFIKELWCVIKPNGYIIMRRLNGDYLLEDLVKSRFTVIPNNLYPIDQSFFYTEIVVAKKSSDIPL